jgi:nucleotide-binding universal stress UspA family protein
MQTSLRLARILVPLDGSTLAEAVMPVAERLAHDHESEVLLLEVLEGQRSQDAEIEADHQAGAYLRRMADGLRGRGLARVRTCIWYGDADQAIANAVTRERVDLVAMSTHGRSGLDRLRFGSVAESVVRKASVPALLVRDIVSWDPGGIKRILVPLDWSAASEGVLPIVSCLAGPFDFEVQLLHVIEHIRPLPGPEYAEKSAYHREAQAYLARVAATLEARGVRLGVTVRYGSPAEVIAAAAAETNSGLIAMATHGRSGLGRLFLGSVAERVLRSVSMPVLLWKPPVGVREP